MDIPALTETLAAFGLIALAEMGDKTQLVCMTLAARHPPMPVLIGASVAFTVLNTLAVLFGASLAAWLPETAITLLVAGLFAFFGWQSLQQAQSEATDTDASAEASHQNVFVTTFLLIFLAELGDKTQMAVAGLASTQGSWPTWIGGTIGLVCTSALGVLAGRTLLQRIPLRRVHQASGVLFLGLAAVAVWQVL